MKHAFSRMKSLIIQLLAYVLCTLCKDRQCITVRSRDGSGVRYFHMCFSSSPGPECGCEEKERSDDSKSD